MRVKFLKTYASPTFTAAVGEQKIVPDDAGDKLEAAGFVEILERTAPVMETAEAEGAPETATEPKAGSAKASTKKK